jgi:glycosyltransferase involved in cell wall biosynthesis
MDLSITIASYNSCQVTRQALESIRREACGLDYEVIVVDNASTDSRADLEMVPKNWAGGLGAF